MTYITDENDARTRLSVS
ncbi:DUF2691 family protein [Bacillus altitudinis]|uniref:DUF2691 family protein n=1 Tax=Bacillus aerius TaxID=293388 RepID=A0AB39JC85_9BACI